MLVRDPLIPETGTPNCHFCRREEGGVSGQPGEKTYEKAKNCLSELKKTTKMKIFMILAVKIESRRHLYQFSCV